ncbi:MAG: hypothetical protein ACRC9L_04910 [Brevinema sp.]
MYELEIRKKIGDELRALDYPQSTILWEYLLGRASLDILIVDPNTQAPMAIIEIKKTINGKYNHHPEVLKRFQDLSQRYRCPVYFVVGDKNDNIFWYRLIDKGDTEPTLESIASIPSYAQLSSGIGVKVQQFLQQQQKKEVSKLSCPSRLIAIMLFMILVLDGIGCYKITNIRLYIIILWIFIILLPYWGSIKLSVGKVSIDLSESNDK